MGRGAFLAIEGTDDSSKNAQVSKLVERLEGDGYDVVTFDFPQYQQPSSYFVQEYLSGKYGSAEEVGPYTGSVFYALDRYQAAPAIREAIEAGKVVIANCFTGSNMAHQGTKFDQSEYRRGYFIWLDNLEFEMLKIPRPDRSIVLRVPTNIAQSPVSQNPKTNDQADLQGADLNHTRLVEVYDDLCQLFPKDFVRVDCARDEQLLDDSNIHKLLWQAVEPLLPPKPKRKTTKAAASSASTASATIEATNPYLEKIESGYKITASGEDFFKESITNVEGNVYAFTSKMNPLTVAAAMARLSRRRDDMRITILDEFATAADKDEKLLQRVITAYGDDSVQQLAGQHLVVEGASNLLTKKLEWGRLAAYLEQSTRYMYFDHKDEHGKYKYYIPEDLDTDTKVVYEQIMDRIFDLYSEMARKATAYVRGSSDVPKKDQDIAWQGATRAQACDAIRSVLPVATKATVGIFASGQALESLIMHMLSDDLPEARVVGKQILDEARKVIPTFLERADKPDRGGATMAYMANTRHAVAELADKYLPDNHASETEAVQLTSVWPRNELDLVPDILYEHSTLPLKDLQEEVATWPIGRRMEVFESFIGERLNRRHRPGRALEKAHYSWDLVCDYGIFRDLQRHRMVDDMNWQLLTPRYGYDIPRLVDDADLIDLFEECFDLSLKLYSTLQAKGYALEAQYATLLGHKMRWKVTYNAREAFHLHELRTSPQGHPGYRKLVQDMHERLAEVHPMIAAAMKFVNQGEDEALTRLAAERYTQFKLNQLS